MPLEPLAFFRLDQGTDGVAEIERLARRVFGLSDFDISHEDGVYIARERGTDREVELDSRRGSIWMADWAQLWNPDMKPALLDDGEACRRAREFFARNHLFPAPDALPGVTLEVDDGVVSHSILKRTSHTEEVPMDVHVVFPVYVVRTGSRVPLATGAKWCVTFGHEGAIINCVGSFLKCDGPAGTSPALPPDVFIPAPLNVGEDVAHSTLRAYERVTDVTGVEWLLPVYLVTLESKSAQACTRFPATEHSKEILDALVAQQEGVLSTAGGVNLEELRAEAPAAAIAATWTVDAREPNSFRRAQVEGFISQMREDGWVTASFAEDRALEEHWNSDRAAFVEQVDLAYYCGHASSELWKLAVPVDGQLSADEVNRSDDPVNFGQRFVNWIIVAACGPLQDPRINDDNYVTDALARWQGAFNGLMGLCAFATTSLSNPSIGKVFARTLRDRSVPRAWFRSGRQCQGFIPSVGTRDGVGIWMSTVTVDDPGAETFNFKAAEGRGARDRRAPRRCLIVWTPV